MGVWTQWGKERGQAERAASTHTHHHVESSPEHALQGLTLQLQYSGHLMRRANSLEKTLMLGKTEHRRRRGRQRTTWLDGIINSTDMSLSKLLGDHEGQGSLVCYSSWGCKELETTE